jgi:hypothetical protein
MRPETRPKQAAAPPSTSKLHQLHHELSSRLLQRMLDHLIHHEPVSSSTCDEAPPLEAAHPPPATAAGLPR